MTCCGSVYYEPQGIEKTEEYYLNVSRLTLLGVGLVALVGAFFTPTLVLTIVSYAVALTGAAFAMPMLLGLVWPRTSPQAAYYSSVGGFAGSGLWAVLTESGYPWAKAVHPIFPRASPLYYHHFCLDHGYGTSVARDDQTLLPSCQD
ncbi:MAG: sodium:solute symporter family transporter [bacterium]